MVRIIHGRDGRPVECEMLECIKCKFYNCEYRKEEEPLIA